MRLALLLLLACFATLIPRAAEATSCAPFEGGVSPSTGAPLPARGVIYLFVPLWHETESGRTRDLASIEEQLSIMGATYETRAVQRDATAIVLRLAYQATSPKIELTFKRRYPFSATYPIVAELPKNHATVKSVEHRTGGGGMTLHQNAISIELDSTALAYRLAWSDGSTTFVPNNLLGYVSADPDPDPEHRLLLGDLPCMRHNVMPERLAVTRAFKLFALYADGTEAIFPVTARARLGTSKISGDAQLRLPTELVGTTAGPHRPTPLFLRLLSDLRDNLPLVALCFTIFFGLGFFARHRRNQFRR